MEHGGYEQIVERVERFSQDRATALTVSFAQSLDGAIAFRFGARTVLSNELSMRMTHALRARHDAVVVGVGTVLSDDPRLTARGGACGLQPRRVVLDRQLRTPPSAALFGCQNGGPVCIATSHRAPRPRQEALEAAGAEVWRWDEKSFEPCGLRARLAAHGVRHAMLEGGATLLARVLESGCFDYTVITISPRLHPCDDAVRYARSKGDRTYDLSHCEQTLLDGDIILDGPVR